MVLRSLDYRSNAQQRTIVRPNAEYEKHPRLDQGALCLEASPSVISDAQWVPLNSAPAPQAGWSIGSYAQSDTRLSRALRAFAERIFYLRATRIPAFSPSNTEGRVTRDAYQVTPFLKWLYFRGNAGGWKALQASFSMVFDEVKEIAFADTPNGSLPVAVLNDGLTLPVDDMGFGLRNVLHVLATLFAVPQGSIVFIDEPEQGLNQQKQRDFATILETIRPDVTVVCATQAEAFCRGLSTTGVHLAELHEGNTILTPVDVTTHEGLRKVARGMGINPLFLNEGGKIIFVEGPSDRAIVEQWMKFHFAGFQERVEIQELGGCGKIGEEFAKPMFKNFNDNVFFLLDSDGESKDVPVGAGIRQRQKWFATNKIQHSYVLRKRELENYIGHDAIAKAAGIHSSQIQPPTGTEDYFDLKAAVKKVLGYYDEKKISVQAFNGLPAEKRRCLFDEENEVVKEKIRTFLG